LRPVALSLKPSIQRPSSLGARPIGRSTGETISEEARSELRGSERQRCVHPLRRLSTNEKDGANRRRPRRSASLAPRTPSWWCCCSKRTLSRTRAGAFSSANGSLLLFLVLRRLGGAILLQCRSANARWRYAACRDVLRLSVIVECDRNGKFGK
jgi:hypothetical protein